jgi:hypothetical protein
MASPEVRMLTLKCAGLASLAFMLLLTQLPTAAMLRPAQASTSTNEPAPSGLVVVIQNVPQSPSLDLQALNNPYINGVSLQIHWSDIEPVEGKPDWSKLDALFAAAQTSKKWVHVLVFPGFFTPTWALEGVKTDEFALPYGPGHGTVERLPMPWDTVYLNRWFSFLKQLSDRYGTSPAFRVMAAAGPTSVSDEATLPKSLEDVTKWQNDGYTPSKYLAAWQQTFQVYAADFPKQYISLSVGRAPEILDINDQGKKAPRAHLDTRQAVVNEAIAVLGSRFALQMSALHAGPDPYPNGPNSQAEDQFVIDYNGRFITGFEMGSQMEGAVGSRKGGAPGNPPLALRRSIDLGMELNSSGQHVNYVEIYEPDVLPAAMQPVLRYGASLFAPQPPIQPGAKK